VGFSSIMEQPHLTGARGAAMNDRAKIARWQLAIVDVVARLCRIPIKVGGMPFGAEDRTPIEAGPSLAETGVKPCIRPR